MESNSSGDPVELQPDLTEEQPAEPVTVSTAKPETSLPHVVSKEEQVVEPKQGFFDFMSYLLNFKTLISDIYKNLRMIIEFLVKNLDLSSNLVNLLM